MKIAIVCNDTRGGVEPYVAVAGALARRGHDVRAIAPAGLGWLFETRGIATATLSMPDGAMDATRVAERGTFAAMRFMRHEMPAMLKRSVGETLAACEGAELMLGGVGGMVTGLGVAERLGIPFVPAHLQPIGAPTGRYPGVLFGALPNWIGNAARRLSHHLSDRLVWMPFARAMRQANADVLGLHHRPRAALGQPIFYGFSRHVVPMPTNCRVTGWWHDDQAIGDVPADLAAFVAKPGPVVSIGFGSMASADPAALTAIVVEAVRRAGLRAVLLGGWAGLGNGAAARDIFTADAVPHAWLFRHVAAAVHHGGSGTTGAAFRAGKPQIVVPFAVDQPFWASRVEALGCGPPALSRRRLSSAALAEILLRSVEDVAMGNRSSAVAGRIAYDQGAEALADRIGVDPIPGTTR